MGGEEYYRRVPGLASLFFWLAVIGGWAGCLGAAQTLRVDLYLEKLASLASAALWLALVAFLFQLQGMKAGDKKEGLLPQLEKAYRVHRWFLVLLWATWLLSAFMLFALAVPVVLRANYVHT